jgi:PPOX class probable FMN-dependent enzyme
VFRGFPPDRNALLFVTDVRSEKVSQLQVNPMAELCWYFTQTREQFRIAGEISVITAACGSPEATNLRQHLWEGLSAQARHQFTWPPPGRPHANSESKPMPTDPGHSLDTFAVLLLDPDRVDHLELRGNPQNRTRYDRVSTANWQMQAINP